MSRNTDAFFLIKQWLEYQAMQRGVKASLEIVNFIIENVVQNDTALMIVDLQASRFVVEKDSDWLQYCKCQNAVNTMRQVLKERARIVFDSVQVQRMGSSSMEAAVGEVAGAGCRQAWYAFPGVSRHGWREDRLPELKAGQQL